MFNSVVLNVVIGLVFIYLLYSLLATIIQELITSWFGLRARGLLKGISRMLNDDEYKKDVSNAFYDHPLIKFLGENKFHSKPSYLTAQNFSKVMIDLLRGENMQPGQSINPLIQQALNSGKTIWGDAEISPQTLSYLKSLWTDAQADVEKFRCLLENWFDDTMERASGWFKKKTQLILFIIGLVLAIIFNVDTISIVKILSNDPKLADKLANNAAIYVQNHKVVETQQFGNSIDSSKKPTINSKDYNNQLNAQLVRSNNLMDSANDIIHDNINDANKLLGLGWSCHCKQATCTICFCSNFRWWSIIGWLITALALSLGAPFWFDLLNKLVQLRSSKKETDNTNKVDAKSQPINLNLNNNPSEEAVG
jgi:hypothetical protein